MLHINRVIHFSEVDSWDEGCIPDTGSECVMELTFKAGTKQRLLENLVAYFEVPIDNIELNACEEMGRIDVCRMENSQGLLPSEEESQAWKRGEINLFAVTYTMYVVEQTPFNLLGE
jgi:hypothetical protein